MVETCCLKASTSTQGAKVMKICFLALRNPEKDAGEEEEKIIALPAADPSSSLCSSFETPRSPLPDSCAGFLSGATKKGKVHLLACREVPALP